MATFLTPIKTAENLGEGRFAARLSQKLEDDYLCWHNVPVGPKRSYPDFIVLHPRRGLLVLEVKDWKLQSIQRADPLSVALLTPTGLKHVPNPLEQGRAYAMQLADMLERDPVLRVPNGKYQGRLVCPWGYGAILANITRKEFDATDLGQAIDEDLLICQDEMTESVDALKFQSRLWRMFKVQFQSTLTMPQVNQIRAHIFPDVRVDSGDQPRQGELSVDQVVNWMNVMDLEQERAARRLRSGHRVIHGVAGSGKTLILGFRCLHLAETMRKPILVLCYNVALAAKLQDFMHQHKISDATVTVRHFHGWCNDQLTLYHVEKPAPGTNFPDRLVERVIGGVDRGQIPRAQYGAVMIDEGHDFNPEWLKLVVQMVDPESNSFLLLYDSAQSIYRKKRVSLSSLGIQAIGRTTILKRNYRNTIEVLDLAWQFAKELMQASRVNDDETPLVDPISAGRGGSTPDLVQLSSLQAEVSYIAEQLRDFHEHGRPWNKMAVLYRARFVGEEMVKALKTAKVPFEWLQQNNKSRHFNPNQNSVKVMTIHSSKGLEFPIVAIPGIGFMPYDGFDPNEEARLLYVGMTRAMDQLILTASRQSNFVARIEAAHAQAA